MFSLADYSAEIIPLKVEILKCTKSFEKHHSVVLVTFGIAVIENDVNPVFLDARFAFSLFKENAWQGRANYFATHEHAYLAALGEKYHGVNNSFAFFAGKMLQASPSQTQQFFNINLFFFMILSYGRISSQRE